MVTLIVKPSPDLAAWQRALTATEAQLSIAATRALNKTARWARTQVASQTAKALSIKVGPVRAGLVLVRATRSQPQSVVGLSAKAGAIKAKHLGSATQNATGVRVGQRQFDHAFLATMPQGHQGVFRRRGKTRLPIQEVHIVVTGKMQDIMEELSNGPAMHQFQRIFERELRFLLRAV
jgi:hypothetical protein